MMVSRPFLLATRSDFQHCTPGSAIKIIVFLNGAISPVSVHLDTLQQRRVAG